MDRNRLIRDTTPTSVHAPAPNGARLTASVVAGELTRLTPRDRFLLNLLDQHKTFTTDQLVDLTFGSAGRARNRLNTVYIVTYFVGGATGATLGGLAWSGAGWLGVCAVGGALSLVALLALGLARRPDATQRTPAA